MFFSVDEDETRWKELEEKNVAVDARQERVSVLVNCQAKQGPALSRASLPDSAHPPVSTTTDNAYSQFDHRKCSKNITICMDM